MRILLTGATGLLGRNLLFEIIKQSISNLDNIEIFLFLRPKKELSIIERIDDMFLNDGLYYLGIKKEGFKDALDKIKKSIIPINFDLTVDNLGLGTEEVNMLMGSTCNYIFHVAALTDFRSDKEVVDKLEKVNVLGTQRVIELTKKISVQEFIYISSAYVSGRKRKGIQPDDVNPNEVFRNPYEKSKLQAEMLVRKEFKKENNYKVFRPTTICGRLIENPIGAASKYDVFYAWLGFFVEQKLKKLQSYEEVFVKTTHEKIRVEAGLEGGLNIIPADYAAKVLYACTILNGSENSHHLANPRNIPHRDYISWMLEFIMLDGYELVDGEPLNKNRLEKLYYRTVGKIFTPYIVGEELLFDLSSVKAIIEKNGLLCPTINKEKFWALLKYAKKEKFGNKK